ncbi:uncharacterized protein [Arachis hypogaea]|uniref:uncharacterized protein n=1 Tax=Arachis hypogaea TaxID=3818 RepID=UPI003B214C27
MLEHQINLKRSRLGRPLPRAAKPALDKQSESGLVSAEEVLSATQCTFRERLPAGMRRERGRGMERHSSMWRLQRLDKREGRRWRKINPPNPITNPCFTPKFTQFSTVIIRCRHHRSVTVAPPSRSIAAVTLADFDSDPNLIVQSAVVLGNFACCLDAGVRAVLDAGAFPHLIRLLSASNDKVAISDGCGCNCTFSTNDLSIKIILAPKYDFFKEENLEFLLLLLKSENENLSALGASIIIHSCKTGEEQNILSYVGVLDKLISLLYGSLSQRDASLESIAAIVKNNSEAVSKFVDLRGGRALSPVIELSKDKYSRTRLLACLCLICVKNASSCHLQDTGIKTKLINNLLEAPFPGTYFVTFGQIGLTSFNVYMVLSLISYSIQRFIDGCVRSIGLLWRWIFEVFRAEIARYRKIMVKTQVVV